MELISNKADALKNKIRPGSIFVSKRTDNLKYIDQDGGECWVVPMSRYYAKDIILRGQPVAICQQSDFIQTDDRLTDKYPYVKVYDPNIDEFCIGVATNYAEPGQIVQIQNKGKFNYLTTDSKKAKLVLDNFDEYLPKFKKIIPADFKKMQQLTAKYQETGMSQSEAQIEAFYKF